MKENIVPGFQESIQSGHGVSGLASGYGVFQGLSLPTSAFREAINWLFLHPVSLHSAAASDGHQEAGT